MDIQMPVMDGYQACQAIRQFNPDIPIIALTAAAMVEDKKKALQAGMNDHLTKPLNSEALYRTLNRYVPLQTSKPVLLIVGTDRAELKALAKEARVDYQVKIATNIAQVQNLVSKPHINHPSSGIQAWLPNRVWLSKNTIDQHDQLLAQLSELEIPFDWKI
jgi:CheY-like chemotaxis protein